MQKRPNIATATGMLHVVAMRAGSAISDELKAIKFNLVLVEVNEDVCPLFLFAAFNELLHCNTLMSNAWHHSDV